MAAMKRLAVLFLLCVCVCAASAASAEQQIVISFLGDCTIGCEERVSYLENGFLKAAEREGYAYFFKEVYPLLSHDDLTVANLEGVLKENAYGKAEKTYNFRGLPSYAQILLLGSVEAVSLENNHADDYGYLGRRATKAALAEAGISYFDFENEFVFEKDGIRIAFLSAWQRWMFQYGQQYENRIASLKESGVNAVVVYVHFGEEYNPYHIKRQSETAYRFIDAGADLIIGSHPHVVQGMEVYKNRLILYSLGNFVFGGNVKVRALETIIPQVTFVFSDSGEALHQQLRIYPAHVSGDAYKNDYQPRLVTGEAADAVYELLDQDSMQATAPILTTQTQTYRDYAPIPCISDKSD